MPTILKLGPADHGRPLTLEEFLASDTQEGYRYELIRGRLYVSPKPNFPQGDLERWIFRKLDRYSDAHSESINYVHFGARIFLPEAEEVTAPEPDVAAYRGFPTENRDQVDWQEVTPILVVEVISPGDPDKDFVRNLELYFQVPSIREYWILDGREGHAQLRLHVHRRHGRRWRPFVFAPGDRYTTRLLPDFELIVDPTT